LKKRVSNVVRYVISVWIIAGLTEIMTKNNVFCKRYLSYIFI
jgi:hypothetical protein